MPKRPTLRHSAELTEKHDNESRYASDENMECEEDEEELQTFRVGVDELGEDEELVPAAGAYKFLHRLELDWPCLSFDFLDTQDICMEDSKYPLEVNVVAGSQADSKMGNNKLYVMKWSNINKNMENSDNEDDTSSDSEVEEEDAQLKFRQIPLKSDAGASNRVRTMPQMKSIVGAFSEDGKVRIFNVQRAMDELNHHAPELGGVTIIDPLYECESHHVEGYGLAWNPVNVGQLISADQDGKVNIWLPSPGGSWEVVPLQEKSDKQRAVLDAAWKDGNFFATAHEGGAVKLWDIRSKAATGYGLHTGTDQNSVDINALAWNPKVPELILTGSDDGSFKIYDARNFNVHLAHFHWHKEQITSVAWHPTDETTLLVASGDDSVSFWDMSVEADDQEADDEDYPAQLLFLHQGQQWIKEAKFSNKYINSVATTAADGFNFFRTCNI